MTPPERPEKSDRGMKLAIVGSVSLAGNSVAATIIETVLDKYAPSVVVSGGAVGVDSMAVEAARKRGIPVVEYLPKVQNWAQGFKPRNLQIARGCDRLVRIVAEESSTYGSGWTRDRAKEMGKPVEEHIVRTIQKRVGVKKHDTGRAGRRN